MKRSDVVNQIENFVNDYVTLADPHYSLPIALWILGTFCYMDFDAFPYLVITSPTKRSGKTRLSEMISYVCSNPRNVASLTPSTLFRLINSEQPTLVNDEAEELASEAAGAMRSILNVGYRKGQTVPRVGSGGAVVEFNTYCPKIFVLIGDVYDTLRDRSIEITMQRAETRKRFTFEAAQAEGRRLRQLAADTVKESSGEIRHAFSRHTGLPFLMDRDEEIWTSLFTVAQVFCPSRIQELEAAAADMSAAKTGEARKYTSMKELESKATNDEYATRALRDLYSLFVSGGKVIPTDEVIKGLKAISAAPWRKFKGDGINPTTLAAMLDRFGVGPVRIALGSGRGKQKFVRGYKRTDVEKALNNL